MEQQSLHQEEIQYSTIDPSVALRQQGVVDETAPCATTLDTQTQAGRAGSLTSPSLTTLLQEEASTRRRDTRDYVVIVSGFVIAMSWMINRLFADPEKFFSNVGVCFMLVLLLGIGMIGKIARRSYRRRRALTSALSRSHSVEQVGPLIQTLRVENTAVRNLAKLALTGLLPEMKVSDTEGLGGVERDILLRQLAISPLDSGYRDLTELFSRSAVRREVAFRIAILKALEQVGGAKELPAVAHLARGLPTLHSVSRVPAEVQEAARECLPYLQERTTAQLASRQLLRASSADATASDTLLRPAEPDHDAAAEHLLRAGASDLSPHRQPGF